MNKVAYIFPGQASQYVGMGRDLFEKSERVRSFYRQASALVGDDLARISFEGPAEQLKRTLFTQPAILVHSLALLELGAGKLPPCAFAAGHSLGEYAALAACGAMSFEDAITAVCTRARLMEQACLDRPGTMAAILALPEEKLDPVCRAASTKGIVGMANINSALQIAVSGEWPAVEETCRLALEAGAKRAIMLEVGGAFHSPLMASAVPGMTACLNAMTINDAAQPVVANVTGRPVQAAADIRRLLIEQITAPVRWRDIMTCLRSEQVDTVFEIGPGKVLTGLAKREIPEAVLYAINTLADLEEITAKVA